MYPYGTSGRIGVEGQVWTRDLVLGDWISRVEIVYVMVYSSRIPCVARSAGNRSEWWGESHTIVVDLRLVLLVTLRPAATLPN